MTKSGLRWSIGSLGVSPIDSGAWKPLERSFQKIAKNSPRPPASPPHRPIRVMVYIRRCASTSCVQRAYSASLNVSPKKVIDEKHRSFYIQNSKSPTFLRPAPFPLVRRHKVIHQKLRLDVLYPTSLFPTLDCAPIGSYSEWIGVTGFNTLQHKAYHRL